ncbi:MAG: arylsulfatase [Armatimonadota bacterium]
MFTNAMTRRAFFARSTMMLGSSAALRSLATAGPEGPRKPNFLVVLADDMGFSDAGCYGGEIQTPNLDRLAAGGLRFTQFYSTGRCWPSRASLLTGFYAQQVNRDGVQGMATAGRGGKGRRPPWAPLLGERLRPLGYRSYHSGKWHLDGQALQNGFDASYILGDHNRYFSPAKHMENDQPLPAVARDSGYYATTAIADHAIRCLQRHAEQHAGRPFFHYLAFTSPHFPLHALQDDIDRYRGKYRQGWDSVRKKRWRRLRRSGIVSCDLSRMDQDVIPGHNLPEADLQARIGPGEIGWAVPWTRLTDAQKRFQATKMAIHAAMIHRMDREIGRVVDQVKAMGAYDNTVILFASDNGASAEQIIRGDGHDTTAAPGSGATFLCLGPGWSTAANTPFRLHKIWVHEGGISSPLIVHWPAGIRDRGALRHDPGHFIDVSPTLLELAGGTWADTHGGETGPPCPGRSLVPAFAPDGAVHHDFLFWSHAGNHAFRVGDWKLVSRDKNEWELYDLRTDRCESHDKAGEQPERVEELSRLWRERAQEYLSAG